MRMLVLAGGFGTRLQTAVAAVPKALAPVGATPFLHLQIEHWIAQGIRSFVFLLYHQAEHIIGYLQSQQTGLLKDCRIEWVIEPTPMDTGGAVAHAVKELNLTNDFLLTNADTWLGTGVMALTQKASPAMAVVRLANIERYGQVHFDGDSRVTAFAEKNTHPEPGWINAGLCRLNAELFSDWDGRPFSLERDLFCTLVRQAVLQAVPLQTDFMDIGIPEDYYRFCHWIESGRQGQLCS
ncbi:MAG: NTP transferase domain-containing protein [Betaproteobacteria bacterium]|nr:NTP transferase domain-containing protein [Betaproteobacteria bacterium]